MSNLEELIEKLCPDGVEYKSLIDLCDVLYGFPCDASKFNDDMIGLPLVRIRDVLEGKSDTYTIESVPEEYKIHSGDLLVGMDGNFHVGIWKDIEAILCQRVCRISSKDNDVLLDGFLNHLIGPIMKKIELGKYSGTVKHLLAKDIKAIKFPVPPLEVQREIVRILDNFTFLTTELAAELAARQKQYEYFRDLLLNDCNGTNGKIIDMLVQPITDGPHTTPTLVSSGIPFVSAEAIFDGRVNFEKKRGFITEKFHLECCRKYKPQKNDVYLVKSGSTTGKVAYVYTDEEFNIWSPIAALRTNADNSSRFLFHLLQSNKIQQQVKSKSSHGSQPNLSMRVLEQFDVVIPSLEEQNQIANLLDRFDALCNDISSGLPAEIEVRKKQYEYYRDKLLTFKELKKEA